MRLIVGFVKNAGNEEAGEDEEQVDPEETILGHSDDSALESVGGLHLAYEMEHQDH
jgi:hypothetical protein